MPKYHSIGYDESRLSLDGLVKKFHAIPAETTDLYLTGAFCHQRDVLNTLSKVIPLIPGKVTSITLSNNSLWMRKLLNLLFLALGPNVTTLDLSLNELGKMGADDFVAALKGFPKTVRTLKLDENYFSLLNAIDLAKVFAAIPPCVTTLTWQLTKDSHLEALQYLPKTLKTLIINLHDLDKYSLKDLLKLKEILPPWVRLQTHIENSHDPIMQRINKMMGLSDSSDSPPTAATAAAKSGAAASVSVTQGASSTIAQKTGSPIYAPQATAAGVLQPSLKKEPPVIIPELKRTLLIELAKKYLDLNSQEMNRLVEVVTSLGAPPPAPAPSPLDRSSDFKM